MNELDITGPNLDLDRFIEMCNCKHINWGYKKNPADLIEYEFGFSGLVYPSSEMIAEGYNYQWCLDNWGTKWQPSEAAIFREPEKVHINFDTAWTPPEPWVKIVARLFPTLRFELKYCEPGCCFGGVLVCKGDEVVENHEYVDDDDFRSFCIKEFGLSPFDDDTEEMKDF